MSKGAAVLLKGFIRGKTIELEKEPGLPDGQAVRVEILPAGISTDWLERIVLDPSVAPYQPVIKGTHILAEDVVRLLDAGQSDGQVLQTYPELTGADLAAVREYARVPAGLRHAFGSWAEDAEELDRYLEWSRGQRKADRRELEG